MRDCLDDCPRRPHYGAVDNGVAANELGALGGLVEVDAEQLPSQPRGQLLDELGLASATLTGQPAIMGEWVRQCDESLMQVFCIKDIIVKHRRGISIAPELDRKVREVNEPAQPRLHCAVGGDREQIPGKLDLTYGQDGVGNLSHHRWSGDRFKRGKRLADGAANLTSDHAGIDLGDGCKRRRLCIGNLTFDLGLLTGHGRGKRGGGRMQVLHGLEDRANVH